jgi:hypothetical protein
LQCLEEMVVLAALEEVPADPEAVDPVTLADPEAGLGDPAAADPAAQLVTLADLVEVPVILALADRVDPETQALIRLIRRCIIGDQCLMGCSSTSRSWLSCIVPGIFCVSWIWEGRFRPRSWIFSPPCLVVPSTPE